MPSNNDSFAERIIYLPWWVGALLSLGSYVFLRFVMPSFFANSVLMRDGVEQAAPYVAGMFASMFAVLAIISFIREIIEKLKNKD